MAVLWTCLLLVVALMSSAVAGAAVKPQYRARLSCGAVPDDKVRSNRPFPWVVKILDKDGNFLSAGSLILDNLVLTSAQFVNSQASADWTAQLASGERVPVQKVTLHPDFTKNERNDLALVYLANRARLDSDTDTMCLFTSFVPKDCIGYSIKSLADGGVHVEKFDLPILPSDQCLKTLREKNLWGSSPFPANNLCTSGERAICRGSDADRGTGMFCPVPEKDGQPLGTSKRYVQVGVSSWGQGCSGQPGMYTNVPFFSTWLQKAVVEQLAA